MCSDRLPIEQNICGSERRMECPITFILSSFCQHYLVLGFVSRERGQFRRESFLGETLPRESPPWELSLQEFHPYCLSSACSLLSSFFFSLLRSRVSLCRLVSRARQNLPQRLEPQEAQRLSRSLRLKPLPARFSLHLRLPNPRPPLFKE